MGALSEALQAFWLEVAPVLAPSLVALAVVAFAVGAVVSVIWFSVARLVWLYKHPDLQFEAAFNYVFWQGILELAIFGAAIAAVWALPQYILSEPQLKELRFGQGVATIAMIVAVNFHYRVIVLGKIARPPT